MEEVLTSLKINKENYSSFKQSNLKENISLYEFVNVSLKLYLTDESFKNKLIDEILKFRYETYSNSTGRSGLPRTPKKIKSSDESNNSFLETEFTLTKSDKVRAESREF